MKDQLSIEAEKVLEFSRKNTLFDCEKILVGLSGGPDSTALLSILYELKTKGYLNASLFALHVNHMLRGEDADRDEELSRAFCLERDIPFVSISRDVKTISKEMGRSEEETGRILRYRAFREFAKKEGGNMRISVAHHRDDLAETMMMNLFRGCALEGLVSPRPLSGDIIRPLLCLSKKEILGYLERNNTGYAEDITNSMSDCTRNIWRNDVLPAIGKVSVKDPSEALNDTYELLKDDLDLVEQIVEEAYDPLSFGSIRCLTAADVADAPKAVGSRLIRRLWLDTFGDLVDFTSVHTNKVAELCSQTPAGTVTCDLPFGRIAFVTAGMVGFSTREDLASAAEAIAKGMGYITSREKISLILPEQGTVPVPGSSYILKIEIIENNESLEYNNMSWFFPFAGDDHSAPVVLENNRPELSFRRAGSSGSRKIRKLFMDRKIPADARDSILFLTKGDEVLWIPGIGHAKGFTDEVSHEAWIRSLTADEMPDRLKKISFVIGEEKG